MPQEQVEGASTLGGMIDELFELRAQKEALALQEKALNARIEQATYAILTNMESEDLPKASGTLGTVSRKLELYPSVVDMPSFMQWCVETGNTHMVQKRVSSAAFKEYFAANNEYPDGLDAFEKASLNVRRAG